MLVFDANVFLYAVDEDSEYREPWCRWIEQAPRDPSPAFLRWNIWYERLRVSTRPRAFRSLWKPGEARRFIAVDLPGAATMPNPAGGVSRAFRSFTNLLPGIVRQASRNIAADPTPPTDR